LQVDITNQAMSQAPFNPNHLQQHAVFQQQELISPSANRRNFLLQWNNIGKQESMPCKNTEGLPGDPNICFHSDSLESALGNEANIAITQFSIAPYCHPSRSIWA